jgi:hypothetical protein
MKTLKSCLAAGALALAMFVPGSASAAVEVLNEGFGKLDELPGWSRVNNSVPAGTSWFQGNSDIFRSQSSVVDSYAAANFLGAANGLGLVDNWLMTPVLSLTGQTSLSFWTRHEDVPGFSDLLEVRFGSGAAGATADFTTLLGTIGTIGTIGGAAGYPADWTEWSTSLNVEGEGRFAFRYLGDAQALNYIGLDTVRVVTAVPEPSLYLMLALGLGVLTFMHRKPSI